MNIEPFPHILGRIAGGSYEHLEELELPKTVALLETAHALKRKRQNHSDTICAVLYKAIPAATDAKMRGYLVGLRRLIFKQLEVTPQPQYWSNLSPDLMTLLNDHLEVSRKLRTITGRALNSYAAEICQVRSTLRQLVQGESFTKGLALSSKPLLLRTSNYLKKEETQLRTRDFQTERGLLRYLTRMYAKTSPFSLFGSVAIVSWSRNAERNTGELVLCQDTLERLTQVHANRILLLFLRELFLRNSQFRCQLRVRVNRTLKRVDNELVFLLGSWHLQSLQRLQQIDVLEEILQLVSQHERGITVGELVSQIVAAGYENDPEGSVELFLCQLMRCGLLEVDLEVSTADPFWDRRLLERANLMTPSRSRDQLVTFLRALISGRKEFESADSRSRVTILDNLHKRCQGLFQDFAVGTDKLDVASKPRDSQAVLGAQRVALERGPEGLGLQAKQMLYEDSCTDASFAVDHMGLRNVFDVLDNFFNRITCFEGFRSTRDQLRQFFESHFGRDSHVSLLTVYEEYYRERKRVGANPKPTVPRQLVRECEQITNSAKGRSINDDELILKLSDLTGLSALSTQKSLKLGCHRSRAAMIQLFTEQVANRGRLMAALNATVPGYGKGFSRFLFLLPSTITHEILDRNAQLAGDHIFCELLDISYSSADVHPPLMPFCIDLPPRTSPPSKLDLEPHEVHSTEQNRVLVPWGVWPPAPAADRPRRCEAVFGCTPFATS